MNRIPVSESSSNYHRAGVSLRECHPLALPEDPVSRGRRFGLYALRIEMGRMCLSFSSETEGLPTMLSHADLISTARFRAVILTDRERSLSSLKVGEVA